MLAYNVRFLAPPSGLPVLPTMVVSFELVPNVLSNSDLWGGFGS